jgi:hypothetical protein
MTEAIFNIYAKDKSKDRFNSLNSFMIEWEISTNFIKRIPILAIEGDGSNGSEIIFHFPERYYEMYDVFTIEETRQQCMVMSVPIRRSDACTECICRLIDNDYKERIANPEMLIGTDTRFLTNHMPELHEVGYVKYQSSVEKARTFIGTTRNDIDMSAKYAAMEDHFINVANNGKEFTYKLNAAEKVCLDSFMESRNNKLLFSKGNFDANGRVTLHDDIGRPVIAAEGAIPQIERFATKFVFNKLSVRIWEQAMAEMADKADQAMGNTWTFVVNKRMWDQIQRVMGSWLRDYKTDGAMIWSKGSNSYVKLGATYNSYEFGGNVVTFILDRSLDLEYSKKAYGFLLDMGTNDGTPNLMFLTFKNGQLIHNTVEGVGGMSGLKSGPVSSPVAGSKIINWGYHGVAVTNPYKSVILEEI